MIRKLVAASLIALALPLGSALAADLPAIKGPPPPPPPPPPLWTGFYVGLNAGGTFGGNNSINTYTTPTAWDAGFPHGGGLATSLAHLGALSAATSSALSVNNGGFIGGGQIGYNWQFGNSFVAGIEADIQGVAGSNQTAYGVSAGAVGPLDPSDYIGITSVSKRLDYLGTVRGRLGWLFSPTLLAYATGGLAYGGVQLNHSVGAFNDVYAFLPAVPPPHITPTFGSSNFSDTRVGWTVGAGLEWLFLPNWSAKLEYLYYDLGSVTTYFFLPQRDNVTGLNAFHAGQTTTRFDGHVVRVGVNYHFNWAAPVPVVAKY